MRVEFEKLRVDFLKNKNSTLNFSKIESSYSKKTLFSSEYRRCYATVALSAQKCDPRFQKTCTRSSGIAPKVPEMDPP